MTRAASSGPASGGIGKYVAAMTILASSMTIAGSYCKITEPGHRLIETQKEWEALWKDIGRPPPQAMLGARFAAAVFAGTRESGGYKIAFDEPMAEGGALLIRYRVEKPKGLAIMVLTQPYAVRLFEKTAKPVRVEERP